jgi:hypothetical protein
MSVSGVHMFSLNNNRYNLNMPPNIFPERLSDRYSEGMDLPFYEPHSATPVTEYVSTHVSDTTNTALKFAEGLPGMAVGYARDKDETFHMCEHDDVGIADLLSRPQKIYETNWGIGTQINQTQVSILGTLLRQKRVVNRINNLEFMNATVHIRVVVSGVPQHFGIGVVSLDPWPNSNSNLNFAGGMNGPTFNQLIQLPHVFIDPSTSTGGELYMPLVLPHNALVLRDTTQIDNAMVFHIMSLADLQSVSPNTTSATVSVWAWLSDVVISTVSSENLPYLVAQSGDEYGTANVSRYATTLSKWAEYFEHIPVIGPYARASTMLLGGTAKIAELFGYSRPSALKSEISTQHRNLGNLTNYNCEDSCIKLSLDSKAEVTVDPRVSGINLRDELAISSLVTREGYIGNFLWSNDDAPSKPLCRMRVTPTLARRITSTGTAPTIDNIVDMTPLGFVSTAFRHWRGTIRFRFVVVCSHFHKGRLRIVFEPGVNLGSSSTDAWTSESNVNQSYILDLACSKELTIEVPWATAAAYLRVPLAQPGVGAFFDLTTDQSLTLTNDRGAYNGSIGVHVLAPLVSPETGQSVQVLLFVSGAPDMEFQRPFNGFSPYMFNGWEPQSGSSDLGADVLTGNELVSADHERIADVLETKQKAMTDKLAEVHYGERVVSVRQLIKRYTLHQHHKVNNNSLLTTQNLVLSNFPSYRGWDVKALYNDVDGKKFNYARDGFLAYFALAFLGYRGSIRQKYAISTLAGNSIHYLGICNEEAAIDDLKNTSNVGLSNSQIASSANITFDTSKGAAVTIPTFNNVVEAEVPWYNPERFHFAQWLGKHTPLQDTPGRNFGKHRVTLQGILTSTTYLSRYVAAGDDFQFVFFKYAPCALVRANPSPNAGD